MQFLFLLMTLKELINNNFDIMEVMSCMFLRAYLVTNCNVQDRETTKDKTYITL